MIFSILKHFKCKVNKDMYKHCRGCNHLGFDRRCMMTCLKGYEGVCPRNSN